MKIIGLSGKAGTGKNFIAKEVLTPLGYREVALADEIKIRAVVTGAATYEEAFYTKPPHVRKWLQEEGTQRGREVFGEDCWVRAFEARLRRIYETWGVDKFAITDVRFPNEAEAVRRNGGMVLRIVAPERAEASPLTAENRLHVSETALDGRDDLFDGYLVNTPDTTADQLLWQVQVHLHAFWQEELPMHAPYAVRDAFRLLKQLLPQQVTAR